MFQHRELGLVQAYQVGAAVVITVVFWVYFALLNSVIPSFSLAGLSNYFEYYLCILLAFHISFMRARQKDIFSITSGLLESHRFIRPHILFAGAITCMFLVLTKDTAISRVFLFTYLPLAYLGLVGFSRYVALGLFRKMLSSRPERLMLVGTMEEMRKVEGLLKKAGVFGFRIVGMVTEEPAEALPAGIVKFGNPDEMERVLREHEMDSILIMGSPRDRRVLGGWMRWAEAKGCRVTLVNDLDVFLQRRVSFFRCDGIDMIELREEPLQNRVNFTLKRALDMVVSLGVVTVILPVLTLIVWICQRTQAPGPIFFRQERSGLDNRHFTILKFRTMYADQCDSAEQARKEDERVFPAGRWLRRFSIDEFPQFLNVLKGEMSLVGPRPHMLQHDQSFAQKMMAYRVRGFVKPGITGLAQIRGLRGEAVGEEDIVRRVESDIEYIETWSFSLDVRIFWRTFIQLLRPPKSAY